VTARATRPVDRRGPDAVDGVSVAGVLGAAAVLLAGGLAPPT